MAFSSIGKSIPDDAKVRSLWDLYGTPEGVRLHCMAVCRKAEELALSAAQNGTPLDVNLIRSAALLHDLCRTEKDHAAAGADALSDRGYPELSDIIRVHHDRTVAEVRDYREADIVYLADKLVDEADEVSLEERFLKRRRQIELKTPPERLHDALAAWERRYNEALRVRDRVVSMIGRNI